MKFSAIVLFFAVLLCGTACTNSHKTIERKDAAKRIYSVSPARLGQFESTRLALSTSGKIHTLVATWQDGSTVKWNFIENDDGSVTQINTVLMDGTVWDATDLKPGPPLLAAFRDALKESRQKR